MLGIFILILTVFQAIPKSDAQFIIHPPKDSQTKWSRVRNHFCYSKFSYIPSRIILAHSDFDFLHKVHKTTQTLARNHAAWSSRDRCALHSSRFERPLCACWWCIHWGIATMDEVRKPAIWGVEQQSYVKPENQPLCIWMIGCAHSVIRFSQMLC